MTDIPNHSPAELAALDRAFVLHPFTSVHEHLSAGPRVMVRGQGVRLHDATGKEYLDAMAGLWCVNIGYGRPEMARAMAAQCEQLSYYHSFMGMANPPSILLAQKLVAMTPPGLNHVFFANSGSEANDTLVKLVWLLNNQRGLPQKKKFITRRGAYHGVTVATASLSGLDPMHAGFDLPVDRFLHVTKPHHYWNAQPGEDEVAFSARLAQELEDLILAEGPDTVAAFVAEPVMGAGGVVPPPAGYFEAIAPVLKRHGVWFCVDEVISGFGRLGQWFGSEVYDLKPDFMTLAKGLTSGYVPMSALMVGDEPWEILKDASAKHGPFAHGFTYSAHPLSAAVALENLRLIEEEDLPGRAARLGAVFQKNLRAAVGEHPLVGEVRGLGLIAGVELVADKARKIAFDAALGVGKRLAMLLMEEEGLICRPIVNTLAFSPPLVVGEEDLDQMVISFARGLEKVGALLVQEGICKPGA